MRFPMPRRLLPCLLLALATAAPLRAGEAAPGDEVTIGGAPTVAEEAVTRLLRESLGAEEPDARAAALPATVVEIRPREAAMGAIEASLAIQRGRLRPEYAEAALREARALFHPVLSLTTSYTRDHQYGRSETDHRWRSASLERDLGGGQVEHVIVLDKETQRITGLREFVLRNPRPAHDDPRVVEAVEADVNDGREWGDFDIALTQQLPWGPVLDIALMTHYQRTFYGEDATHGGYDRPWTTDMSIGLVTPLPYTKGFGRLAQAETNIRLARLAESRAWWEMQSVLNTTLLEVDHAYWDLVAAAQALRATVENRKIVEALHGRRQELLEAERATRYGLVQVESELAGLRDIEQEAWAVFVRASNRLAELLNADTDTVYVPVGYSALLDERVGVSRAEALERARRSRPELRASAIDGRSTEIELAFYRHETRPDLAFRANVSLEQNGASFGFKTLGDSLERLPRQWDTKRKDFTLAYTYPLFNRPARGAYEAALARHERQGLATRITENAVEQEVGDAIARLVAARSRLRYAEENARLAAESYGMARDLLEAGRLDGGEFQILQRSAALLSADYAWIAARIEQQKAEALLLAAQGVLPQEYGGLTAPSELESHRLGLLERVGALAFFGDDPDRR
jgi:outer membrane protein TolC